MVEKLTELLKTSTYTIPSSLLLNYSKLKISDRELIVLIYLLNNQASFNPRKISQDLNLEMELVLEAVNELTTKDIVSYEMRKVNNLREEHLILDNLYKKLAFLLLEEKEVVKQNTLYDNFEKEFGRTLSPMEYEIIGGWQNGEFIDEVILCALEEAVYNGVFNLRYIDKILYEWKKKGVKNKADIEATRYQKNKKPTQELVDYDWLNEDK